MMMSRTRLLFFASLLSLTVGCGVEEAGPIDGQALESIGQKVRSGRPPPNGANGTRPACFWAAGTQQALRTMGGLALDRGGGQLLSIPLTQVSADCREVLRSAVECSLTPEQSVVDPMTGERYEGWWGLAPSWLGGTLNTEGRRYVTGCMVQRLNYQGLSVPILLEGAHPAIAENPTYGPQYALDESTVFGDLFSSTTPLLGLQPAFNVFVCWESLLPQACGSLGLPVLFEKRICDDLPLCGITTLGPCSLSCVQNGPYWKCRPHLLAPAWTETVRVKLDTATCQ